MATDIEWLMLFFFSPEIDGLAIQMLMMIWYVDLKM
jgi:hypothetical protein